MRAICKINLSILKENYLNIRKKTINKNAIVVLKDNAYGHDLVHVSKIVSTMDISYVCVATFEEALTLRKNLIFTPILLLERCHYYRVLSNYKITLSVSSLNHLKELASSKFPLLIHLEINSGMNRTGIECDELSSALQIISNSNLTLKGIFTHVANQDSYNQQLQNFNNAINNLNFKDKIFIHIETSSYLNKLNMYSNTIRFGMGLYLNNNDLQTKQVLSLYAPIIKAMPIKKGDKISYNQAEIEDDGYLYTLSIGYGDGWRKDYDTIGYYNNFYLHQVGVTNMDHLMLFSKNKIEEMQFIELIGDNLTIEDLCTRYSTTSYELCSSLSPRLNREFITKI